MQLLAPARNRLFSRFAYGAVAYWILNGALLLIEARWHLLYRLTLWDAGQLQTLAAGLSHLPR